MLSREVKNRSRSLNFHPICWPASFFVLGIELRALSLWERALLLEPQPQSEAVSVDRCFSQCAMCNWNHQVNDMTFLLEGFIKMTQALYAHMNNITIIKKNKFSSVLPKGTQFLHLAYPSPHCPSRNFPGITK
jgi:hypothetical protein